MHLLKLVLFTLSLPSTARRNTRIGDTHHDEQQHTNAFTKANEVFLPLGFVTPRIRPRGPQAHGSHAADGQGPQFRAPNGQSLSMWNGVPFLIATSAKGHPEKALVSPQRIQPLENYCRRVGHLDPHRATPPLRARSGRATVALHAASSPVEGKAAEGAEPGGMLVSNLSAIFVADGFDRAGVELAVRQAVAWFKSPEKAPEKVQQFARQLLLIQRIQRLKELQKVWGELGRDKGDQEWADAAGLSVPELNRLLDEGLKARNCFGMENMGLVYYVIRQLRRRSLKFAFERSQTEDDLAQEGCIALLRAAELFDASRGNRFSTYAYIGIRRSMNKALYENGGIIRIPMGVYDQYRQIDLARTQLRELNKVAPSINEICVALAEKGSRLTPARVREVIEAVEQKGRPQSLDALLFDTDSTLLDLVGDQSDPEDVIWFEQLQDELQKALSEVLDPVEEQALKFRFGLADGNQHSHREVAAELGMDGKQSDESARRVTWRALLKLRRSPVFKRLREFADFLDYERNAEPDGAKKLA